MSEKKKSLVSHESLRIMAAAAEVGEVSPDVLSFLSASAEYHLLDVVKDASLFCSRGKRSRLSVDDIKYSLELRGVESSVVIGEASSNGENGSGEGAKGAVGTDVKVDLRQVANASLPVCPREPSFGFHWLAVDGKQPLVPENPTPSSSARGKTKVGSKRSRSPSQDSEEVEGTPNPEPRLSEELQTYLRRCCEAVLSRDEERRTRALTSLRNDQGLLQLLTPLCAFLRDKLFEYLTEKKDPDQLAALLQMVECLLLNPNFAFIEIYLDKLMPPLLSCLLHEDFERQGKREKDESVDVKPKASKGRVNWTHWNVRDYAAELIGAIHHMYGGTYPALQARTISMCCKQMEKSKTPMTTMYGAIRGLAALGSTTMKQILWPLIDKLVARISHEYAASVGKQDADAMQKANLCTMALLQATGATTVFNTQGLFGLKNKKTTEPGATTASAESTGASGQSAAASSSVNVATEGKGGEAGRAAGAAGSDKSRATEKSAAAALRRRSRMQKRLDKSLYLPRGTKKSSRPSGGARKEGSAGAAAVGDASELSPLLAYGGAGVPQDGHALQELLISWYVTGLKKADRIRTRWLTNRLGVFI